jgi:hypothetical protein
MAQSFALAATSSAFATVAALSLKILPRAWLAQVESWSLRQSVTSTSLVPTCTAVSALPASSKRLVVYGYQQTYFLYTPLHRPELEENGIGPPHIAL